MSQKALILLVIASLIMVTGCTPPSSAIIEDSNKVQIPELTDVQDMIIKIIPNEVIPAQHYATGLKSDKIYDFVQAFKGVKPYPDGKHLDGEVIVYLTLGNGEMVQVAGGNYEYQTIRYNGETINVQGEALTQYFKELLSTIEKAKTSAAKAIKDAYPKTDLNSFILHRVYWDDIGYFFEWEKSNQNGVVVEVAVVRVDNNFKLEAHDLMDRNHPVALKTPTVSKEEAIEKAIKHTPFAEEGFHIDEVNATKIVLDKKLFWRVDVRYKLGTRPYTFVSGAFIDAI